MFSHHSNSQIDEMSKVRCVGNVIVDRRGRSKLITKCVDISSDGVNVLSEVPLIVNSVYPIRINAFRNGKTFQLNLNALCSYSMLSSSDFKVAFKFREICYESENVLKKLLR